MQKRNNLLAVEMLATADSIRQCRQRVLDLVRNGYLTRNVGDGTDTVLGHGLDLADAMENLAQKLAQPEYYHLTF